MCRKNTCPWTDSIMLKEKVKFVCQKSRATFVPVTICDCVRLHRMLKKWWRSSRMCSNLTSPHMPNLTTTRWWVVTLRLRQIYTEKGTSVTYWIGSWWTPEMVWMFCTKKSPSTGMWSSFPQSSGPLRSHWNDGDIGVHIIAYACENEPASAQVRSYGCSLHTVCSGSNGPQRRVRTGTLLT